MSLANSNFNYGILQLRGVASLSVVFCHFGSNLKDYPLISEIFNKGQFGVHIFFLISGYVILLSLINNNYHPKSFFKFLLKRILRIDPPYIITIILTLLIFFCLSFLTSFQGKSIPFIPGQFISHLLYIIPFTRWEFYNHIFWTLGVEFQFYVLIGLLYFLNKTIVYKVIFLLLFSGFAFLTFKNSYYLVTNYAPIFAFGMTILEYTKTKHWSFIIVALFCLVLIFLKFQSLITLLILIASLIIYYTNKSINILNFLGKISYSLYLIHPLTLIFILGIAKRLNLFYLNDLVFLFLQILICIAIGYIYYNLIEKKSIQLSQKLNYKNNESV